METTKIVIVKHKKSGNIKIYGNATDAFSAIKKTKLDRSEFSITNDFVFGEIRPNNIIAGQEL